MTSGQTKWNGWHPNLLACTFIQTITAFSTAWQIMSIEKNKVDMFFLDLSYSWLYIMECIHCLQTIWPCLQLKLGSIFLFVVTKIKRKKIATPFLLNCNTFNNILWWIHLTSNYQEEFSVISSHMENN